MSVEVALRCVAAFRVWNEKKTLDISSKECSINFRGGSMSVTPALGRLRWEGCLKFKASLGYISTRPVRATQLDTV